MAQKDETFRWGGLLLFEFQLQLFFLSGQPRPLFGLSLFFSNNLLQTKISRPRIWTPIIVDGVDDKHADH